MEWKTTRVQGVATYHLYCGDVCFGSVHTPTYGWPSFDALYTGYSYLAVSQQFSSVDKAKEWVESEFRGWLEKANLRVKG